MLGLGQPMQGSSAMFFSQEVYPDGTYYTQGAPRRAIQTKTSRGEEPRNKTQENSPAGSQVDLGFSDRNRRKKNGYVKSKEDASLTNLLLNACSFLNKFDEALTPFLYPISHI